MERADLTMDDMTGILKVCGCFNLRRTSRAVTNVFDDCLAPCGLRSTQATILFALLPEGEMPMMRLASRLDLTLSTLSRNLQPMIQAGYLTNKSQMSRSKIVSLTESGWAAARQAFPLWRKAQDLFLVAFGEAAWIEMLDYFGQSLTKLEELFAPGLTGDSEA